MSITEQILNLCSTVRFERYTLSSSYSSPSIETLRKYSSAKFLEFKDRVACLEAVDDINLSMSVLYDVSKFDMKTVLKKNILATDFVHHFIHMITNEEHQKIMTKKSKKLELDISHFIVGGNTVVRGNNVYRFVQLMCRRSLPKFLSGITTLYETEHRIIPKDAKAVLLHDYFNALNNDNIDHLVPILQLFYLNDLLTVKLCRDSVQIVMQHRQLIGDLADFFVHGIQRDGFEQFKVWARGYIAIPQPNEPLNGGGVLGSSQSVHLLDKARGKMMLWLAKQTEMFDPETRDHKIRTMMSKFERMKNKLITESKKLPEVANALRRVNEDNTDIIHSDEVDMKWSLSDTFDRVCFYIANHKEHEILYERLKEELADSSGTCFSGHFNRLFNVFTGFEENLVYVNINQEFERVCKVFLQNIYNEADDKVQDEMMDLFSGGELSTKLETYLKERIQSVKVKMIEQFEKQMSKGELETQFKDIVNKFFGRPMM